LDSFYSFKEAAAFRPAEVYNQARGSPDLHQTILAIEQYHNFTPIVISIDLFKSKKISRLTKVEANILAATSMETFKFTTAVIHARETNQFLYGHDVKGKTAKLSSYSAWLSPLDPYIWLFMLVTVITITLLGWSTTETSLMRTGKFLIAALVSQYNSQLKKFKWLFLIWMFICIIISNCYTALIQSTFIVSDKVKFLETFEELSAHKYQAGFGSKSDVESYQILTEVFANFSNKKYLKKLNVNNKIYGEYKRKDDSFLIYWWNYLFVENKNTFLLGFKKNLVALITLIQDSNRFEKSLVHLVEELKKMCVALW